ncbi:PIR Superfamily Protein [Plasmodium ovale wallikeri]|uniref:PIR Superfamily Protein n=1 Tax=Plasmodium ovale wallikeri TaxID=864142 RepID=A0A1A9AP94_PLAOA|nr:PIR Superfamily Protein [Plasmodium ovale wallikeri]
MTLFATSEDLPSYEFYKKFNEGDSSGYYGICKAEQKIKSDEKLVQLCSKILKNLKLLDETHNGDTFRNKRCNDLNYWISEQLYKYHGVKDEQLNNSYTYIYLYTSIISINKIKPINNKCSMDFDGVTTEEKRRRKNLYDYYENYEKLEKIFTQKGKKCSKEHHEYLAKCVDLYNETQQFCTPGENYSSTKCPLFFSNSKIYYPNKDLSVMPCELEVQSEVSLELEKEAKMVSGEGVGRPPLSGVHVPGDKSDTDASSEPSLSLSKTLMSTSIPVLGSCFFFFILYRWTPVGSIIRNRLLNKGGEINGLHNNVGEELWGDSMESLNINSDRNGYQLAYQSL